MPIVKIPILEKFEDIEREILDIEKQTKPMEIDKVNPISNRIKRELADKIKSISGSVATESNIDKPIEKPIDKAIEKPIDKATRNNIDYSEYIHKSQLEELEKSIKEKIDTYYVPKDKVPDMSKYILKTEIPSCPSIDMDKYIPKTKVPVCSPPVDLSKYMLKTEIPPCVVPGDENTKFTLDYMSNAFTKPIEKGNEWNSPYQ